MIKRNHTQKWGSAVLVPTLGFFGGFAGLAAFLPLIARLSRTMGLSPVEAATLAACANLSGSLLRIPFGAWADKYGPRRPFLFLLGTSFAGLFGLWIVLAAFYPDHMRGLFGVSILLALLVGAGIATFPVGIQQTAAATIPERHGRNLGLYAGLGNLGPGVFSLVLPLLANWLGIVAGYGLWLLFFLTVILIYAKSTPATLTRNIHTRFSPLREAAKNSATWSLTALYFTGFGGFLALLVWLPSFWHSVYGLSLVTVGTISLGFTIVASMARIIGGWLQDRTGPRSLIPLTITTIALSSVIMGLHLSLIGALLDLTLLAIGLGLQNGATFKLVSYWIPNSVGGASGWIGGIGALGGFIFPPLMAWFAIQGSTSFGFFVLTAGALLNGAMFYSKMAYTPHRSTVLD